jgi:hypothetical protein
MNIFNIDTLKDERSNCFSVMTRVSIADYLELVRDAYNNKGGIDTQREPLKTSSAIRIRSRMVQDIRLGATLPPIVLGLVLTNDIFVTVTDGLTSQELDTIITNNAQENVIIIDGMQRTTALIEARGPEIEEKHVRVEFWISNNINSLVYRMLVLNTGQVPWNLRRQIEVVFGSMLKEIGENVPEVTLLNINDNQRRTQAGQFQSNDIIELYLAFGARKEKVDAKERLADEFTRLDFIEATETDTLTNVFYGSLNFMGSLDKMFGRFEAQEEEGRFVDGKDLFKSQPARVGLITALAKRILGRPGIEKSSADQLQHWEEVKTQTEAFLLQLGQKTNEEIGDFLAFDLLNESLTRRSGRVGDFEREFFTKAFETLIELHFDLPSLAPCWRAY